MVAAEMIVVVFAVLSYVSLISKPKVQDMRLNTMSRQSNLARKGAGWQKRGWRNQFGEMSYNLKLGSYGPSYSHMAKVKLSNSMASIFALTCQKKII
jgi:hypothetical protein